MIVQQGLRQMNEFSVQFLVFLVLLCPNPGYVPLVNVCARIHFSPPGISTYEVSLHPFLTVAAITITSERRKGFI